MLRKPLFLLLLVASIALAQSFRFGVEGGLPLTNAFNTGTSNVVTVFSPESSTTNLNSYSSSTRRYTVGATAELDLPSHLAFKVDVLYKRLGFDFGSSYQETCPLDCEAPFPSTTTATTTANSWEIPLLAKHSVGKLGPLQPYVEGGIAFRTVQGVRQTTEMSQPVCVSDCNFPAVTWGTQTSTAQTSSPAELNHGFTQGFVAGAGLELRHLRAGVFGEIRYTHWTADAFSAPNGLLKSTRNQADLLMGVTF
ncbi:MAG: outer membrane beta-barrel protein [Bryobacteraceae bacterium]|jgi:opacity protein-like surface antigen